MPLRQRFETLLLFDPNRSPATANVSISHPSPSEEQALGKLVIISTITGHDRINLDIISLIQDELRSSYYQSVDAKPERAFEQALHQTNKRLHQVITEGVGAWVDQASILAAVVWRDTVIISSVGSIHAYLLRRSVRDGRASFGIHTILDTVGGSINPVRIFPHTITGQLQPDDQLLFCTPSLLDYFSLEKLRRTLADGQPDEAVHHWEATLLGVEQRSAFAAVVIQTQSIETVTIPSSRPEAQSTLTHTAPQVSMEHLIAKEQATERLLSPSIWPAVRDVVAQLWQALSRLVRRLILRKPPRRVLSSGIQRPPPLPVKTSIWSGIRRGVVTFFSAIFSLIRSVKPRNVDIGRPAPSLNVSPMLQRRWRPSLNSLVTWFQNLSRRQQGLSVISVLLVIILAVAILPRASSQNRDTTTSTNGATIADELAKAKAALLYGGDETAAQNLSAARALYEKLPNRSAKDKSARQSALSEINTVASLLARMSIISTPTVIAQLAAVAPQTDPRQLYLVGTRLVTLDPQRTMSIIVDTNGKNSPAVVSNELDTGAPQTGATSSPTSVIFTTDRQGFIELDVAKSSWKPVDSAWPTTNPRIQSITLYQSRVYALDAANNEIVRFARSANSLGTGVSWLKESAVLTSARGMAVDGSIYILQPNGLVDIFTNGRKGSFSLAGVEPPMTDATRLWTDVTSTKLYLVDPGHKRIVVFTKTGKLLNQYQSESWNSLRDIAINEKTKTAYVLSGTTITSFTLLQ